MIEQVITGCAMLVGAVVFGLWCRLCWMLVKECLPKE